MKFATLAMFVGAVFAADGDTEATDEEKLVAAENEIDEAIANIEEGLKVFNINADELVAYNKCMEGKVLPDKVTDNTAHL